MNRILILYGTTDGQTAKIASFLGAELGALGATVDVRDAGTANPDPRRYAGVIVAASVHGSRYQRPVVRWVRRHAKELREKPGAFLSVCLGVLQPDITVQRELGIIHIRFEMQTGWRAPRVKWVAGALPYTKYGWLKRAVMKRIVKRTGGSTDVTRDHEYTDWADLLVFAAEFYAQFEAPAPITEKTETVDCGCACAMSVG